MVKYPQFTVIAFPVIRNRGRLPHRSMEEPDFEVGLKSKEERSRVCVWVRLHLAIKKVSPRSSSFSPTLQTAFGLRASDRPAYPRNLQQLWQQKRGRPSDQNECPALFDHVDPIGFLPAEIFTAIRGNLAFIGRLAIQHSPDWFRVRYTAQKPILGLL